MTRFVCLSVGLFPSEVVDYVPYLHTQVPHDEKVLFPSEVVVVHVQYLHRQLTHDEKELFPGELVVHVK